MHNNIILLLINIQIGKRQVWGRTLFIKKISLKKRAAAPSPLRDLKIGARIV